MKKKYLFGFPIIFLIIFSVWFYQRHPLSATVRIGTTEFIVDLAVTDAEKTKGLGGRKSLDANKGMIFLYDHKEKYSFWMKDMQFPLDFLWLSANQIVDISYNVSPPKEGEQLQVIQPNKPIDKVLEINAGEASKAGAKIGDMVIFNK